jgi:hypothetical protein
MKWPHSIRELASGSATLRLKIIAGCICAAVFIAGLLFDHWAAPSNPWLLILTGFIITLRPFAAVGFFVALLVPVRAATPHS